MTGDASEDAVVRVGTPSLAVVARGISWKGAGRAIAQLTWFLSLLVLAALLEPAAFGLVAVGTVVVAATTLLMEAGTGGGIIVTRDVGAAHLRASVARNFALGSAFTVVLAILAAPISDAFASGADPDVLRVMVLTISVASLGIVPLALLDKTLRFKRRAQVTVVAGVVSAAVAVLLALLGAGVWSLVARQLVNHVLLTGLAWLAVRSAWPRAAGAGGRGRRRMRTGATFFFLMAASQFAAFSADNLVVGNISGVAELGLYALAFQLAFAPLMQFAYEVGGVLLPAMAATQDLERVRARTLKAMRMMALLVAPGLAPAVVLAPTVLGWVLGERWAGMVTPFQLLLVAAAGYAVVLILGEALAATGNVAYRARVDVAWAAGTIGLVIVLTHLYGIVGAASAHLAMWGFYAGGYALGAARRVGIPLRDQLHAVGGVAACVTGQAAVTVATWLALEAGGATAGGAAAGATVASLLAGLGLLLTLQRAALRDIRGAVVAVVRGPGR